MNINCNMADDLLPLYLEESCSSDSRLALEEHLERCGDCQEKLARMQDDRLGSPLGGEPRGPQLVDYGKKIKRHRLRMAAAVAAVTIVAATALAMVYLTIADMRRQENPVIYAVGTGVYDLTGKPLTTTADEVGQYTFYTNTSEIKISIERGENIQGTVKLQNAKNPQDDIMRADLDGRNNSCTFEGLSAASRYQISCDGLEGSVITVAENRQVSFWKSFQSVAGELWVLLTEG